MEMPAKQTPAASSEIVKLIRKLRWVGLEEKAEQLENQLEHQAVTTDTVVSIQNETALVKRLRGLGMQPVRCASRHIPQRNCNYHLQVAER